MIFLALFDDSGQVQRVAKTRSRSAALQYNKAGFVQVTKEQYDALSKAVPSTSVKDLAALGLALSLLNGLLQSRRTRRAAQVSENKLRALQNSFRGVARAEAARVTSGDITPDQWYNIMRQRLKQLHIAAAASSVGGLQGLNGPILDEIARIVSDQLSFLRRFRDDLQGKLDSDTPMSEAQVGSRAAMYAGAATATAEIAATTALGIPRLPAYPGVRTVCMSNCKCAWRKRQLPGRGNWDCFWVLSPVENCPTCLARRRAFSPLRIRNGVIQPFSTAGIYA